MRSDQIVKTAIYAHLLLHTAVMATNWPTVEFASADNSGKRIRVEAAKGEITQGKLSQDSPSPQFFKRITVTDGDKSIELLLDLASTQELCAHLTIVVELARGTIGK